jgi:type II secretory pathway component GspD/PulD (secretin)
MRRLHTLAAAIAASTLLVAAAHAQDRPAPSRPTGPAPTTPAPVAEPVQFQPPPPSPAMIESMQRRDERSVDIEEVLAQVSASSGKKFLVDPRVRARVYGVPKIDNPTYAELLSILRLHGYMAIEIEGRVNIVPDANARFMPMRLLQRDDDSVADNEYVTRILTVPNAPQLVPILRPLMPQSAHLAAMPASEDGSQSSKLLLMDTYANVRRMTEIINEMSR